LAVTNQVVLRNIYLPSAIELKQCAPTCQVNNDIIICFRIRKHFVWFSWKIMSCTGSSSSSSSISMASAECESPLWIVAMEPFVLYPHLTVTSCECQCHPPRCGSQSNPLLLIDSIQLGPIRPIKEIYVLTYILAYYLTVVYKIQVKSQINISCIS